MEMMKIPERFLSRWRNHRLRRKKNQEDRISMLSDDLLHHILSFIDTKFAVRASILSRRWIHVWKSLPHLNLFFLKTGKSETFCQLLLNNRYANSPVFTLNISWDLMRPDTGITIKIISYAISHQIKEMNFNHWTNDFCFTTAYPLFESKSLKKLRYNGNAWYSFSVIAPLWNLPALTLLHLQWTHILGNFSSNFPNLKDLSLTNCGISNYKDFELCFLGLEKLTLRNNLFSKKIFLSAPKLSSFLYEGSSGFPLSVKNDLTCLNDLEITLHDNHDLNAPKLSEFICSLNQFYAAKVLTLGKRAAVYVSGSVCLLKHKSSPFTSLDCLKLEKTYVDNTVLHSVKDYFLKSSPTAAVIEFSCSGEEAAKRLKRWSMYLCSGC